MRNGNAPVDMKGTSTCPIVNRNRLYETASELCYLQMKERVRSRSTHLPKCQIRIQVALRPKIASRPRVDTFMCVESIRIRHGSHPHRIRKQGGFCAARNANFSGLSFTYLGPISASSMIRHRRINCVFAKSAFLVHCILRYGVIVSRTQSFRTTFVQDLIHKISLLDQLEYFCC